MGDVNKVEDRKIYALVANIPSFYHSADLRNYFSQFTEQGGFECFHFRHRPEIIKSHQDDSEDSSDVQKLSGSDVDGVKPSGRMSTNERRGKSLCCVICLRQSRFTQLVKMYHRKCWLDRKGESIRSLCYITKIKLTDNATGKNGAFCV